MANILKNRLIIQLFVSSFLVFFGSGLGWAHSKQETTTPANNAVLYEAPSELVLQFDKPMRITSWRYLINWEMTSKFSVPTR